MNQNVVKTHCPKGHPYSGYNLIVKRGGRRYCRECGNVAHMERYYRNRSPGRPTRAPHVPMMDNFEIVTETGCWIWLGRWSSNGYALIKRKPGHRFMWEMFRGPIPTGMCVCHKCDTPPCINPDHMFIGTHQDNMADMARKGRRRSGGRKPNESRNPKDQPHDPA